jgi:uncharacterized protein
MKQRTMMMTLAALAMPLASAGAQKVDEPILAVRIPVIIQTTAHIALADALVEAAQVSRTQRAILPQFVDLLLPLMVRGNESRTAEIRTIVTEETNIAFASRFPKMLAITRDAYARHLTDQQLIDITAFYRTPSGARFVELTPLITSESIRDGAALGREAGMAAVPAIIERMRRASLKVPPKL